MELLKSITKKRAYVIIASVYLCCVVTFFLMTLIHTQQLVGKKHPGFLVFDNGLVFGLVDDTWTGVQSGLKMYDQIESYNGETFQSSKELFSYLSRSSSDQAVLYQVRRHDRVFPVLVKPLNITQDFVFLYYHIFLFCGLFTLLTGLGIFVIRPLAKGAFHFFLICCTIGLFEILLADMLGLQNFLFFLQTIIALFAIVNIQTIYYLVKMREHLKVKLSSRKVTTGLTSFYVAIICFAILINYYTRLPIASFKVLLFSSNFLFFLGGILIYVTASYLYFTEKSSTAKRRLLVYMGLNICSLIGFVVYVSHNVCAWLIPIEIMLVQLIFPFVTVYVLFKHNFLDLRFSPKRKYFYLSFAVIIPVLFLVDFIFLIPILHKYNVSAGWIHPLVFVSIALKILALVYAAYARIIDKIFFPSTFRFRDLVTKASQTILHQYSQEEIMRAFVLLVKEQLNIDHVYCYFQNTQLGHYQKQDLSTHDDDVFALLPSSLTEEELQLTQLDYVINEFASNYKITSRALPLLSKHNLNLLLPMRFGADVCGFILFGPKPHFVPYMTEDLTNLQILVATTTVALLNAKHHQSLMKLHEQLKDENKRLKQEILNKTTSQRIIGEDKGLRPVFKKLEMLGSSNISVLLHGETGTGKEVVAQAIHERSQRAEKPFIKVNCAAVPENLFESELFGHEKGSFTGATEQKIGLFEAAHGGTLFLDEIGEVPLHIQPKLLRALQEKEIQRVGNTEWISVDVRILAATNRDLEHEVEQNRFRQDLYYRLNVLPIFIPALRDRPDDIEELLDYFIGRYSVEMKKHLKPPVSDDVKKLKNYPWPGNVRELQNVVERSIALSKEGEPIRFFNIGLERINTDSLDKIFEKGDFYFQMEELKKQVLQRAIKKAEGNKSQAARDLGLHQVSLYKMIKQLDLDS